MQQFKEYKLSDFFNIHHGTRLKKEHRREGTIPLITAGETNNGIAGYIKNNKMPIYKDSITVDMFGNVFYQDGYCTGDDNIYFYTNDQLNYRIKLYITSALSYLKQLHSYGLQFRQKHAENLKVILPVKKVLKPDFDLLSKISGGGGHTMYSMTSWVSFKIEDLFESIVGDVDLQKRDFTEQGIPVISAGVTNNGVVGYTEKEARIIPENTITVDMFGNVRYRDFKYKLATHGRIFALKSKTDLPENVGLFLEAILSKHLVNFNYSRMCSWNKIKDIEIKLPAIETEEPEGYTPDWKYMEDYIKELEQDYIKELEGYLQSAGLDNYELTEEEVKALSIYAKDDVERKKKKLDTSNWKKFKLEDLFDIKTTKSANKNKIKVINKGTFEFIGRSSVNNGVQGYVEKLGYEPNEENTLSIVQVGKTCCLYRDKKWYASQNIFKLIPKFDHLNKIHYFITTIIDKNLIYYEPAYVCPKLSDLKDLEIELPISSTIDPTHKYHPEGYIPDWQFIETYMKALEKTVIKEVVDYKNDFINKAKEVISTEKKEIF